MSSKPKTSKSKVTVTSSAGNTKKINSLFDEIADPDDKEIATQGIISSKIIICKLKYLCICGV